MYPPAVITLDLNAADTLMTSERCLPWPLDFVAQTSLRLRAYKADHILPINADSLPPFDGERPVYEIPFANQVPRRASRMHALPTFACHYFTLISHSSPKDV